MTRSDRLARAALRGLTSLARAVPPSVGYRLARGAGRVHYLTAPAKRRAVSANQAVVRHWARGQGAVRRDRPLVAPFLAHAETLYEWLAGGAQVAVEIDGLDHLTAAQAAGRGIILATCHLGNWELAARHLQATGFDLTVVTGKQLGSLASAVKRSKCRAGMAVVQPQDGMRRLYRALAQGGVVALLVDGDIYTTGRSTEFFDQPTLLPWGAARLAARTGAALHPAWMIREARGSYRVVIRPAIASDTPAAVTMRRLTRTLEEAIAQQPEGWCIFRPLWARIDGNPA